MIHKDPVDFRLGHTSICVDYPNGLAFVLTPSLEDPALDAQSGDTICHNFPAQQVADFETLSTAYLTKQ
eukprot:scaffold269198_cov19-Tisochrysis_lutea.AAC.1